MSSRRWMVLAALLTLVLGAGWVFLYKPAPAGSAPETTAEGAPDGIQLFNSPEVIPAVLMSDLAGRKHSSSDWRGKVVLVNFWATWCPPCRAEIPDLIALQKKYGDELLIIGVSEDEVGVDQVKAFADTQGMNYPVVMTSPEIRKIFHGVAALPTTFVLDRDGRITQRHVGMLNAANTEAEVRVLAGLDTTTKVERIENDERVRLENAAQAKTIPGVDLAKLNDTQKTAVVQALLAENCTCGCGLTLAICRLDDPTCPISLPMAQDIVKKYSAMP